MNVATTSRLRDAILETVSTFRVPGAQIAWLSDGRVEQVETGTLDLERGVPVTAATQFPLASVTKVFTATLAMLLVADGDLSLDSPIGPALPAGPVRDRLGRITLAQLLSHTSGLENDHSDEQERLDSTLAYLRALARLPLLFPPGRHFSYANVGYVVVGHLIEAATGLSWPDAVRSFLLDPLDVPGTFLLTETLVPDLLAAGHVRRRDGEIARVAPVGRGRGWAPAAGLATTASGLLRLVQLHLDGGRTALGCSLLPEPLVAAMRRRHVGTPDPGFADAYGLGWALNPARPERPGEDVWFGHDGEGWGSTAFVRASADSGFAVAMVANCLPAHAEWRRLLRALAAQGLEVGDAVPPALPEQPQPIDPAVVGVYEYRAGRLTVYRADGELRLDTSARDRYVLRPAGGDRCLAFRGEPGREPFLVAFLRDEEGAVRYLHAGGRIARRVSASGARAA